MIDYETRPLKRPTNIRYRVVVWLSVAAVLAYFCRSSVGVAESTIRDQLDLTKREMGWVMSAFFWSYALFQVPGGYLGQRFGTRMVLGWSAASWSFAILLFGAAPSLIWLILAQSLMGLAQAAAFPCAVQSLSAWIPLPRRASACAALSIGMQTGSIITAMMTGVLIEQWGWRLIFILYAVPGVLWAIGFASLFRNKPQDHPLVNSAELDLIQSSPTESVANPEPEVPAEPPPWMSILANRSILCLCGQQMFRAAAQAFFMTWFPTFLQQMHHVKIAKSGFLQSTVYTSTLLGGLAGGIMVDRIYRRTNNLWLSRSGVGALCMVCCGTLIFCAYFAANVTMAVILIDFGSFFAALAGPCAYVTTIDLGKQHVPAVFGLMNMMGNLAAAATPAVIGYIFEFTSNWNIVLAMFGLAYFLAAACWVLIDPTQPIQAKTQPLEEQA